MGTSRTCRTNGISRRGRGGRGEEMERREFSENSEVSGEWDGSTSCARLCRACMWLLLFRGSAAVRLLRGAALRLERGGSRDPMLLSHDTLRASRIISQYIVRCKFRLFFVILLILAIFARQTDLQCPGAGYAGRELFEDTPCGVSADILESVYPR